MFLTNLNEGGRIELSEYFAPQQKFVRWWDPTVPLGRVVDRGGLAAHLDKLQRNGLYLTLRDFHAVGFQGGAEAGGWFNFKVSGRPSENAPSKVGSGKGAVDCATGKLMAVVIDDW
jgi:hypothetical protein